MSFKKSLLSRFGLWLWPCAILLGFVLSLGLKLPGEIASPVLQASAVLPAHASSLAQSASDGQALFQQKCKACHTIGGGKLVGPDLQDVAKQRDLAWLKSFIAAPDKLIASGDPTAKQLVDQFIVKMPNLGLTSDQVDALAAYLENPSAAGPAQPENVAALGDPEKGQLLFMGQTTFANGGSPCMGCHTVSGVGAFGGGNLGPDLTHAVQRLGGQPGMASALSGLPFPTMQGIFANRPLTNSEQADLLAFFVKSDSQPQVPLQRPVNWFMLVLGVLGVLALLAFMGLYWPRQRRSVADILKQNG
jgi:mono/diheme cytochrome c family protein